MMEFTGLKINGEIWHAPKCAADVDHLISAVCTELKTWTGIQKQYEAPALHDKNPSQMKYFQKVKNRVYQLKTWLKIFQKRKDEYVEEITEKIHDPNQKQYELILAHLELNDKEQEHLLFVNGKQMPPLITSEMCKNVIRNVWAEIELHHTSCAILWTHQRDQPTTANEFMLAGHLHRERFLGKVLTKVTEIKQELQAKEKAMADSFLKNLPKEVVKFNPVKEGGMSPLNAIKANQN